MFRVASFSVRNLFVSIGVRDDDPPLMRNRNAKNAVTFKRKSSKLHVATDRKTSCTTTRSS